MKRYITLALAVLFVPLFAGHLYAQPVSDQIPAALQQRLQGKTTLKDVMKEVDAYYKQEKAEGKSKDFAGTAKETEEGEDAWLQWKRWEWYMSSRLGPNGEFVNINQKMFEAYEQNKIRDPAGFAGRDGLENISNVSTGSWSFVGPASYGTVWGGLPGNGRVDRVAFDPYNSNIIYAGTPGGGLWKTTDGGSNWTPLSNYMATMGISGIVIDRNNTNIIYVLTGEGDAYQAGYFVYNFGYARASVGVLKSTDGGQTWSKTGDLYSGGPYAGYRLAQCPSNSNILLAATNVGLYRTTNGGTSWTLLSGGAYTDVQFNPSNGNTVFAAGYGKYKVSNDAGATLNNATSFSASISGAQRMEIGISANDTTKVYLLCAPVTATSCDPVTNPGFYGLYRSTNGGKAYTRVRTTPNILGGANDGLNCDNQSNYDMGITVSPSNANFVAICGMTVWVSNDGFVSNLTHVTNYWGGPNENVHPDIHGVEFNPLSGILYACTDGGLYASSNSGTNWSYISNNLNVTQWYHYAGFNNDRTHLGGGLQDNGIRNRTVLTSSFNHVASGDGFDLAYDPNNSSRFYTVINTSGNKYSADGATYNGGFDFTAFFPKIGRHPTTTNTLWVGREDSIFKSTNEGGGFTKQNIGGNRRIIFCPSNPNIIYSANSSKVWRSDNGGGAWTDLTTKPNYPAGSPVITCVAVNPNDATQVFVTYGGFTAGAKVFYSGTSGESWQNVGNDLPNVPVNCVVVNTDNSAYIGTDDGIYYQSPSDVSWLPFYNNLPRVPVTDLVIFQTDQYIYASTFGRGIWFSSLKQACDADLSIGGSAGGQQFYEAANTISSTQTITGGAETRVLYRSGGSVTITPGFEAKMGNEWKAYIGPCDQHGVPVFTAVKPGSGTGNFIYPANFILKNDSAAGTSLPYGYINIEPGNLNNTIELTLKKSGSYSLAITDKAGKELATVWNKNVGPGKISLQVNAPQLSPGFYYITLKYGDQLAHFLEWRVN